MLDPEVQFDADGKQVAGPVAKFTNMPSAPLLTQNIHVPENWMVEVVRSVYDLDNIRLENVESVVHRLVDSMCLKSCIFFCGRPEIT